MENYMQDELEATRQSLADKWDSLSKKTKTGLILAGALLIGLAGMLLVGLQSANAAAPYRVNNVYVAGYADATATSTFATTSYADLPAATVTLTPAKDPNTVEAPGTPAVGELVKVLWTADVIKATSTTGTCAVYVNGAVLAKTARTIDTAAKQGMIGGAFIVPNTATGAQTIKLQCKSGDTAVFTVNNAHLIVEELAF